ncbi:hypothetical protein [Microseira wollei]|uniref:Uncharacterized protein n=1 Tax=Microseira wollei NIES-4236 TaxID=2530354 RepID=A0AAV3WNR5_9CYAN|nr:hypothetical protein [Microseira wollei]GET43494.1 hypothetical protein MiSe_83180 [Microseira wollei NIES-4236]
MFGFGKKSDSKDAPKARKGSNGFYMELDESKASTSENGKQPAESAVKAETAPAPAPAAFPAKATKPAAKSKPAALEAAAAAPAPAAAAAPAKPAAPAAAANGQAQPQAIKTFAPDYLLTLTSTNGRRRPGANMNSFLEMARQMKTK